MLIIIIIKLIGITTICVQKFWFNEGFYWKEVTQNQNMKLVVFDWCLTTKNNNWTNLKELKVYYFLALVEVTRIKYMI